MNSLTQRFDRTHKFPVDVDLSVFVVIQVQRRLSRDLIKLDGARSQMSSVFQFVPIRAPGVPRLPKPPGLVANLSHQVGIAPGIGWL